MIKNQEFINQLKEKIGEIPKRVSNGMREIQEIEKTIRKNIEKLDNEIQQLMMQMNKSSLFRTTVSISERDSSGWNSVTKQVEKIKVIDNVIFNHKGIGYIQTSNNPNVHAYDSTYSHPMSICKMLTILGDKKIHQEILMDLATPILMDLN